MLQFFIHSNAECLKRPSCRVATPHPRSDSIHTANAVFQLFRCGDCVSCLSSTNKLTGNRCRARLFAEFRQDSFQLIATEGLNQVCRRYPLARIKPHIQWATGIKAESSITVRQLI